MTVFNLRIGLIFTALFASNGGLSGLGEREWHRAEQAFATSPEQKAQARSELDQVITSLSSVDAGYASGDLAEAQSKFEEARSRWNKVSPAISVREARGPQLLFDFLETKLKSRAPAAEVNSTVYGILEELSEDVAAELR